MRLRLNYATVMSTVGVFLALGGTSYAVATGSIDSREIRNNAVRSSDIRDESIRSRDVDDGSLKAKDFAAGQLPAGPKGAPGEPGAPGQPGEDATNLFAYIRDAGSGVAAVVQYGKGVSAVDDAQAGNLYTVTFDRSVENCVVHATPGHGDPPGTSASEAAMPLVTMVTGDHDQVGVRFLDDTGAAIDTAFLVTAFC